MGDQERIENWNRALRAKSALKHYVESFGDGLAQMDEENAVYLSIDCLHYMRGIVYQDCREKFIPEEFVERVLRQFKLEVDEEEVDYLIYREEEPK